MKLIELTLGREGLRGRGKPTSWLHIPHHQTHSDSRNHSGSAIRRSLSRSVAITSSARIRDGKYVINIDSNDPRPLIRVST